MGRGGRGRGGGGDKQEAFFKAIETEKVDTVRWSLNAGGLTCLASDDSGRTALMVASVMGKDKSLDVMLSQIRRMRDRDDRSEVLDATDEEGRTALMMAASSGRVECVKMLKDAGARLDLRDEQGYTARVWADWAGKQACVDVLDGKVLEEEEDGPDSAAESEGGFEGETSTQRSKRKKKEKAGVGLSCSAMRAARAKGDGEGAEEPAPDASPVPVDASEPVLPEIVEALAASAQEQKESGHVKELTITLVCKAERQVAGLVDGQMDPALWRCGPGVRHLEIRWRPGLGAGALDSISALRRILHLIVQDSSLPALPEALGDLKELRQLDFDGNSVKAFPKSIGRLSASLESISAARNQLTGSSLAALAPLEKLVTLKLDNNKISDIEDLAIAKKPHLVMLSVARNELVELPEEGWGDLAMLQHLNVSANKLKELPCEMGAMKEKKLTELLLDDNPWKDGKIRSMIENSAVLSNTVLVYLRKMKPKGKKGGAKAKGKKKKAESSDEDSDEDRPVIFVAKSESEEEEEVAPPPPVEEPKKKKKGKK